MLHRLEEILILGIIVGLVFKTLHWPVAAFLIVSSTVFLGVLYFPFGLIFLAAPGGRHQVRWFTLLSGLSFMLVLAGLLCKAQHWPKSVEFLWVGCPLCLLCAVYAWARLSPGHELVAYYQSISARATLLGVFAFIMLQV